MMALPIPSRAALAGGLASLAAWGISLALAQYGVVIPADTLVPVIVGIGTLVTHLVPDTFVQKVAQVNQDIKGFGQLVPQTYAAPSDFPNAPPKAVALQVWKDKGQSPS